MNYSFISLVSIVDEREHILREFLKNMHKTLKENFSDYEIILVNNKVYSDIRYVTNELDQDIRKDVTVINLSKEVLEDNAIVAGLDRANGDYTIILRMDFYEHPELILEMYKKTQENNDVVYLQHKKRNITFREKIFFNLFYVLLRRSSDLKVSINMDKSRIISRRALNSILKLRESMRYMKGIFSYIGYNSCPIDINIKTEKRKDSFSKQFKFALTAIISFTDILNKLLLLIFIVSLIFAAAVSLDAILIKLIGKDLFGVVRNDAIPGWSFLIVMISVMFSLLSLILYIIGIYLSNINKEIKQRPIYIIESIQRI
jgi:vacuolar-type H+-ATPase subunit F/Vma7